MLLDILGVILICLSILLIIYGTKIYFDSYDDVFVIIKAKIREVKCAKLYDKYNCILDIDYVYEGYKISNELHSFNARNYSINEIIDIQVNKFNPIEVSLPSISKKILASMIYIISIMIFAIGWLFFIISANKRSSIK